MPSTRWQRKDKAWDTNKLEDIWKRAHKGTDIAVRKPYELRHTFASHFMMNGGNILVLQRSLGHANLTMTMRYAHLAPDHLQEVVKLNPLTALTAR